MKARFWGTRGSLPAAADTLELRQKMIDIIKASRGREFSNHNDIVKFVDTQFPVSRSGYYGTNTSCVELAGGDQYVICDAGSGIQDFSRHILTSNKGRDLTFQYFSVASALGPYPGIPVFHAPLHFRKYDCNIRGSLGY